MPRAPLSAPEPPPLAPWRPHAGDVAAGEAAASLAGNPDEIAAAIRSNDAAWLARIHERSSVVDAIKAVRPVRCGAPPRFRGAST